MILVKNKENIHKVYIPKNNYEPMQLVYKMYLYGQANNKQYILDLVDEKNYGDYYYFSLDLSNFENQEYKYEIKPVKDVYNETTKTWETYIGCPAAVGLIRIGDLTYKEKHYENSTLEIFYEEESDKNTNKVIYYE